MQIQFNPDAYYILLPYHTLLVDSRETLKSTDCDVKASPAKVAATLIIETLPVELDEISRVVPVPEPDGCWRSTAAKFGTLSEETVSSFSPAVLDVAGCAAKM